MDKELAGKEKVLERLKVDDEIESEKLSISQKKALEHEAKQKYGRDWKKVLGFVGKSIRINKETLQTLHGLGVGHESELRDLNRPGGLRRFK